MIEHENSRLIGQLIGQMEGMTNELRRLNTTMEASVEATHQRFDYERREVNARFDRHENEIREFKWHFLYHLAEMFTRKDFWEVYTELDANHLQSTSELCVASRREFTTPMYDCGHVIQTNEVNFDGSP